MARIINLVLSWLLSIVSSFFSMKEQDEASAGANTSKNQCVGLIYPEPHVYSRAYAKAMPAVQERVMQRSLDTLCNKTWALNSPVLEIRECSKPYGAALMDKVLSDMQMEEDAAEHEPMYVWRHRTPHSKPFEYRRNFKKAERYNLSKREDRLKEERKRNHVIGFTPDEVSCYRGLMALDMEEYIEEFGLYVDEDGGCALSEEDLRY